MLARKPLPLFACALTLAALTLSGPPNVPAASPSDNPLSSEAKDGTWLRLDTDTSRVYVKVSARGLGHSHAVVGKLRPSSRVLLDLADSPSPDADRTELLASIDELDQYLGRLKDSQTWRRYLQVAELKRLAGAAKLDPSSRAKLHGVAGTFENVSRDPKYASVAGEPAFQRASAALGRYVAPAGTLIFDMRTFDADTPEARRYVNLSGDFSESERREINDTMRGPKVLDVTPHPEATFIITGVRPLDGQRPATPRRYQLEGVLQLRGVSRDVSITARAEPDKKSEGALRLRGQFAIRQTDYGITPYSAFFGTVAVADRLEIWGDVVLRRPEQKEPNRETPKAAK